MSRNVCKHLIQLLITIKMSVTFVIALVLSAVLCGCQPGIAQQAEASSPKQNSVGVKFFPLLPPDGLGDTRPLWISPTGKTVCGQYKGPIYTNPLTKNQSVWHYFRWREEGGIQAIPFSEMPKGFKSKDKYGELVNVAKVILPADNVAPLPETERALFVYATPDGKMAVGNSHGKDNLTRSFVWVKGKGVTPLGTFLPKNYENAYANLINDKGTTITGSFWQGTSAWVLIKPDGFGDSAASK